MASWVALTCSICESLSVCIIGDQFQHHIDGFGRICVINPLGEVSLVALTFTSWKRLVAANLHACGLRGQPLIQRCLQLQEPVTLLSDLYRRKCNFWGATKSDLLSYCCQQAVTNPRNYVCMNDATLQSEHCTHSKHV